MTRRTAKDLGWCATLLLAALAHGGLACASVPASASAEAAPLEEVLVTGEQPGPGLWKVTRPDDAAGHALWILGSHSPLPKKMRWRSSELQAVLATSQELLAPPSVDADVGPLGGITLLPSLIGARRNPHDQRLQEVVPPDLYLRWLPLKARYLGNDSEVEELAADLRGPGVIPGGTRGSRTSSPTRASGRRWKSSPASSACASPSRWWT